MGIFWWKRKDKSPETKPPLENSKSKPGEAVEGLNGAVEVRRPATTEVTVFEFGSVAASTDKVTLAGYCPVSEELEPCRWEILPADDSNAPQFRVVF